MPSLLERYRAVLAARPFDESKVKRDGEGQFDETGGGDDDIIDLEPVNEDVGEAIPVEDEPQPTTERKTYPVTSHKPAVPHAAAKRAIDAINQSTDVPEPQRERYAASLNRVLQHMPKAALDRMEANLGEVQFGEDSNHLAEKRAKGLRQLLDAGQLIPPGKEHQRPQYERAIAEIEEGVRKGTSTLGGVYLQQDRSLYLDGDSLHVNEGKYGDANKTGRTETAQLQAHEIGHVIDGPNYEFSKSPEWMEAFKSEIATADEKSRLTDYAAAKPEEGFAEFARLIWGTDVDLTQIKTDFPKAFRFFASKQLIPAKRPKGSFREMFERRIDIGEDGSHADVLKKQGKGVIATITAHSYTGERQVAASVRMGGGILATGERGTYQGLAYSGGPLTLKEFDLPVVVDLEGVTIEAQDLPNFLNHNEECEVGRTSSITVHPTQGITVAGKCDVDSDEGSTIVHAGKGGKRWEFSIGAPVHEMEEYAAGESVSVNGREFRGPVLVARRVTLREVSFVHRGADVGKTHMTIAARLGGDATQKYAAALAAKRTQREARAAKLRELN